MSYTSFKKRTVKPEKGNLFYVRDDEGGFNSSIVGSPTDPDCNVLSNCVGYAQGRFNEIHYLFTGKKKNIAFYFNCNAEGFWQRNIDHHKYKTGNEPRPGAIICWQKGETLFGSDGAGHVAIVEEVYEDGSILISESAYGGVAFKNSTLNNSNGNWGYSASFKFQGFIYHPDVKYIEENDKPIDIEKKENIGEVKKVDVSLIADSLVNLAKEVGPVKKFDWVKKLTSRKFWVAIAGFVTGIILAFKGDAATAETVSGCIMAGASVIAYIFGEGLADAANTNTDNNKTDKE